MADAQASGACYGNIVWVQVPSPASSFFGSACGSVGIGRRARLRILCWLQRVGSSPIFRTEKGIVRFLFLYHAEGFGLGTAGFGAGQPAGGMA